MKKIIQELAKLAKMLPAENYHSNSPSKMLGSEILLTGLKVPPNIKLEDDKEYIINVPLLREKNHKRRLIRAYKSEGLKGVEMYLSKYIRKDKMYILHNVMSQLKQPKKLTK